MTSPTPDEATPEPTELEAEPAEATASIEEKEGADAESAPSDGASSGDGNEVDVAEKGDAATTDASATDDPATLDARVVATFEAELAEAKRQADEHHDRYLRAEADLQNLRRRSEQRRVESLTRQKRDLLTRFLDVRDNLERGLGHATDSEDGEGSPLLEGLQATLRVMDQLLEREGVTPIEAEGAAFDPHIHEPSAVVPMPNLENEVVLSVDRPGYMLGEELLRAARVVVGRPAEG